MKQTLYRVCQHDGGWLVALAPSDWQMSTEKLLKKVRADSAAQALDSFLSVRADPRGSSLDVLAD